MEEPDIEETTLIEQAQAGDKDAFATLYKRYWGRVTLLLLREVKNKAVAEELAQEAFLKAYKYIKSYNRELSNFCTWVGTIALNKPRTSPFSPLPEHFNDVDDISPERIVEAKQELDKTEELLTKLSRPRRRALYLWAIEGLTYTEIGAIMGITAASARSNVCRARADLRRIYDECR